MSYKKVIAIGDSFTRGDELADCPDDRSLKKNYSEMTWPALIAKSLNAKYILNAVGGKGNQWISWQVAAHIHSHGTVDCFYIINWSWFERFDYVDIDTEEWLTTHPRHENKLDHYFYRNLDSELWNLHRNLQQIHSTIALLKQFNINFIMTCNDTLYKTDICSTRNTRSIPGWKRVIDVLDISSEITMFDNMTFLEWSRHNGFVLGPDGHPLEDAHIAAAKYMQQRITL